MKGRPGRGLKLGIAIAPLLVLVHWAFGTEKPEPLLFKYAGGTENLFEGCAGNLEVLPAVLTFKCEAGSVSVPYSSISLMQYRPDVSKKVWKMKPKWKVKPAYVVPVLGGKRNRFFTVLFSADGARRAVVLEVLPGVMRPYLAEIDLKSGKRVEVLGYEKYD